MIESSFVQAIALTPKRKGGYVDILAELSGAAYMNVTIGTNSVRRGHPARGVASIYLKNRRDKLRPFQAVPGSLLEFLILILILIADHFSEADQAVNRARNSLAIMRGRARK